MPNRPRNSVIHSIFFSSIPAWIFSQSMPNRPRNSVIHSIFFFFGHLGEFTFFPLFHGPHFHVFLGNVSVLNGRHDFGDLVALEEFFFNHGDKFFAVHTGHFLDHGFDNWEIWFHHLEFVFHHFHDFTLDHFHHFFLHHFHIEFVFSVTFIEFFFPIFHFFTVFTVFLATSVDIDIGFNFSVNVNPVLLIGVNWSKVNIHNVVIGFTMSHKILEFFPLFFHIVIHIMTILVFMVVTVTSHWAHV